MVSVAGCLQWVLMDQELISFCLFTSPPEEVKPRSVLPLNGSTAPEAGGTLEMGRERLGEATGVGDWQVHLHAWPKSGPGELNEGQQSALGTCSLPACWVQLLPS